MKKIVVILILSMFFLTTNAQYVKRDTSIYIPKIKFSFTPQYILFEGLRFDIEKELRKNAWLDISTEIFLGRNTTDNQYEKERDDYYSNLYGAGLGLNYKHFISSTTYGNSYFSVGPSYNFFYMNYEEYIWQTQIVNGIEELHWELVDISEQIHRLSGTFLLGIETEMYERIYFDMYAGVGLRYSYPIINNNIIEYKYDDYMWSYGYSGTLALVGIRFGILYN